MADIGVVLLDSTLDLVAFFNIFKEDMQTDIAGRAADLEQCVVNNDDVSDVEIIHTGSGFDNLSLPHLEHFYVWNTDADHMIIRTDIQVLESSEAETLSQSKETEAEKGHVNVNRKALVEKEPKDDDTVYIYEGLHSGYVLVSDKTLQHPIEAASVHKHCRINSEFIERSQDMIPLSRAALMATENATITGPSYSLSYNGGTFIIHRDFVFGLKCKFWPLQAQEWIHRHRLHGWPNKELISSSVSQGCHIVPVGSHTSSLREFEWRFSFSVVELKLAESMTENQQLAYSILKAVIKNEMKERGIEVFASYHLKTTLFWFLEKNDAKKWGKQSLGTNILELLDFFITFYVDGFLPNYFICKNNMIDHRSPDEMLSACAALTDIKSNITMMLCRYIETNQALPVFFDTPLTQLLKEHSKKFLQICKYNFLVMALAYILMRLKMPGRKSSKQVDDVVNKLVHKASRESNLGSPDLLLSFSASNENPPVEMSTTSVLAMIEQSLEEDKMKVTEESAVALAVFNLFLTFHPTPIDKVSFPINSLEFHDYLINPTFMECLLWAARIHEKHCDIIYDFVVKKWINGPQFHTKDEQAEKIMKLLMVVLGKPTKQASAVTGALVKREIEGQRFILLRKLAEYLLHVHPESSYIAFQASAYLMDKPVLSEIDIFVNYGTYRQSKLRAVELILSKEELQVQISEKEFNRLVKLQHELTT
jgi:hypothetical protein